MRHLRHIPLAFLLALAAAFLAIGSAVAQEAVPFKVAVLDVQQIMRESKAAKTMQAELEKRASAYDAEIAQREKALRTADQQLESQRASLSQADFQKKRDELRNQAEQFANDVQSRRQQLAKLRSSGLTQIRKALSEILQEIAKAKGITLVLSKSQILLSANAYDITAETLKKLDAKLPAVKLAQQ